MYVRQPHLYSMVTTSQTKVLKTARLHFSFYVLQQWSTGFSVGANSISIIKQFARHEHS